jgi:hypothetical protein
MKIEFLQSCEVGTVAEKSLRSGYVINVCDEGMCLYTDTSLQIGEKIVITKCSYPPFHKPAKVLWIKKIRDDLMKAGIMIIEE